MLTCTIFIEILHARICYVIDEIKFTIVCVYTIDHCMKWRICTYIHIYAYDTIRLLKSVSILKMDLIATLIDVIMKINVSYYSQFKVV